MAIKSTVVKITAEDLSSLYQSASAFYNSDVKMVTLQISDKVNLYLDEQESRAAILHCASFEIDNDKVVIEFVPGDKWQNCYWNVSLEENVTFNPKV